MKSETSHRIKDSRGDAETLLCMFNDIDIREMGKTELLDKLHIISRLAKQIQWSVDMAIDVENGKWECDEALAQFLYNSILKERKKRHRT